MSDDVIERLRLAWAAAQGVEGDEDTWRDMDAAIADVGAEVERLRAEVARLCDDLRLVTAPHESVGAIMRTKDAEIERLRAGGGRRAAVGSAARGDVLGTAFRVGRRAAELRGCARRADVGAVVG